MADFSVSKLKIGPENSSWPEKMQAIKRQNFAKNGIKDAENICSNYLAAPKDENIVTLSL
jgi:hypothetical protein